MKANKNNNIWSNPLNRCNPSIYQIFTDSKKWYDREDGQANLDIELYSATLVLTLNLIIDA